jgi:hypothetical protein
MNTELKPCPFCGHPAHIMPDSFMDGVEQPSGCWVSCDSIECPSEMGNCGDGDGWFDTIEEATAAWNTRAPSDALKEAVAALTRLAQFEDEPIWSDDRDDAAYEMVSIAQKALATLQPVKEGES